MRIRRRVAAGAALAVATLSGALTTVPVDAGAQPATFTPIDQPTDDYTSATCLVAIPGSEGGNVGSMGACGNLVSFGRAHGLPHVWQVPTNGWRRWGKPPAVEDPTPKILVTTKQQNVLVRFRRDMTVGGLEIEPKGHRTLTVTATFYATESDNGEALGTVTRQLSGHGGALLFAATADPPFHAIKITASGRVDLGMGDFRVTPHT